MNLKLILLASLSLISVGACVQNKSEVVAPATAMKETASTNPSISLELNTLQMMEYLSDDNKLGRETGTVQMLEIQQWLIEQFKSIGLKPLVGTDSYLQAFEVANKTGPLKAANVIGYLPCNCKSDRYFIIGAHYDHVGTDPKLEGDQVFNGADDDASGVVASLLIARELAKEKTLPFNIIVAAWDAEEKGLLGSKHFVNNPLVDLDKIETGFMFELVGSKSDKNTAWMTGFQYSSLYPLMKKHLAQQGWKLGEDPFAQQMLFMRSDNAPFALMDLDKEKGTKVFRDQQKVDIKGVPIHAMSIWKGQPHYHQLNDDINVIDIENLTNFSLAVAKAIKSIPDNTRIEWLENPQFNFKRP